MSAETILSLHTLPVELAYRILDHLDDFIILCSMRNVCKRINTIVDSYHRYQVNYFYIRMSVFFPRKEIHVKCSIQLCDTSDFLLV
jgi:hypothetical protein